MEVTRSSFDLAYLYLRNVLWAELLCISTGVPCAKTSEFMAFISQHAIQSTPYLTAWTDIYHRPDGLQQRENELCNGSNCPWQFELPPSSEAKKK